MKLFAPRNDAYSDMDFPSNWWGQVGGSQTISGKRVNEDNAMTYSAVFAATRIISEAIAGLPLSLKEQVDYRTTRDAIEHPLYRIVHDIPNPEQDKVTWFDMQTAFLPNWGNCYAEKQFNTAGQIIALWPIHPSRIPLSHITRNDTNPYSTYKIVAGQPGEIVYWVKNDDSSVTPIPASDMLHVPGVMSSNGITGQSIIRWGANSIGIGMATEEHAGSLFKNGAVTNMVIKSPRSVGKDAADRLRHQWQQTFAGAQNHYKTLLLEEGMDAVPINMNPEETQLIAARQFGITEIARWYKIPAHMLGDLSRSTNNNIEQQALEFVVYSLGPWVDRWQAAMYRQLLTPEEQKRYRFKFNFNAMLRGDAASRSSLYRVMFDLGMASPNDLRELEDWNPVDGGDQRFVMGNNVVPLDKISELVQSQIDKNSQAPVPPPQPQKQPPMDVIDGEFELQREFLRLQFDNLPTRAEIDNLREKIEEIPESFPKNGQPHGPTHDEVKAMLEPLVESVRQSSAAINGRIADAIEPLSEKLDAMPEAVIEIADGLAKQAAAARDTSESDKIAAEKALLEQKQAEIEQKSASEREITDKMLILALKKNIDSLAVWESKAIVKARDKPTELPEWRVKFYGRFVKQFVAELSEFAEGAAPCGIVLDLQWAAENYVDRSILDLKSLDQHAKDNFFDRVKEATDYFINRDWKDRSQTLAKEMIERGRKAFVEQCGK